MGRGQLAIRVGQSVVGHGCEQHGVSQGAPQQLHAGMAACQRLQDAGQELQPVPGVAVGAQRDLIGRATTQIGPGRRLQTGARVGFVVSQRHDAGGQLGEGGNLAHASAHMRSRL